MSSIVIKISFGETLRRLNVSIIDKKLALDMVMLKAKICSLFSFGSDVEFTMTYVDEDGDTVTLVDDDDLHDVVRQFLNPLRITVSLGNNNFNGSSGVSTPLRPSQNQLPFQTLKSGVSEFLKSVPEPLLEALAKLPIDLASKALSSAPVVAELYAYSNQTPKVHPATGGPPIVNPESSTVVNLEVGGSNTKKEKQFQKAPSSSTKSVGEASTRKEKNTTSVEIKKDSHYIEQTNQMSQQMQDRMVAQFGRVATDIKNKTNDSGSSLGSAQRMLNAVNQCPFSGMSLTSDTDSQGYNCQSHGPHIKRFSHDNNGTGNIFHRGVYCDGCGVHPITGPRFKSLVKEDYDLCNVCFAGMGNVTDYIRIDRPVNGFNHHLTPFKGSYDSSLRIPPPMTPYQTSPGSRLTLSKLDSRFTLRIPPPMTPHQTRSPGSRLTLSKLDSRFILDVNVLDGTIMAPFTAFTKIWRMRNIGSIIWPYGSQLQWVGGDRLGNSDSVDIQIPVDGLPVDKELDIAVDFTAPELPGRYVSYWRMSSPSGQKFGQRVWVLIQVDASMKNLGESSIDLNLPPVTRDLEAVNRDYLLDNMFRRNDNFTDPKDTSVDSPLEDPVNDSLPISLPIFNSTEVGTTSAGPLLTSGFYPTTGLDTEPISCPTDLSVMPPIMSNGAASPPTLAVPPVISGGRVVSDEEEQALVKELEQMGFKRLDLNKEILRMNNYDIEKSIDDLCGVLEWDPMLDELQEMGFTDDEANRRLLKKNNGSIKRVVMDLINGERA